jgi:hypothetical protein
VIRLLLVSALLVAVPAAAQERPVRRLEISGGGGWFGGAHVGEAEANLRGNSAPPQPLRLFSTDTRLDGATALEVIAAFAFSRRWGVEGGLVKSAPDLRTSISADAEDAPPLDVVERVDQYIVEGRLVVMLDEIRLGERTIPFASVGAGYLRQLHEAHTVVEEGHVVDVGGGLKHWLFARNRGFIRGAALRVDARLVLLYGGISVDAGPRPHGAISAAAAVAF